MQQQQTPNQQVSGIGGGAMRQPTSFQSQLPMPSPSNKQQIQFGQGATGLKQPSQLQQPGNNFTQQQ